MHFGRQTNGGFESPTPPPPPPCVRPWSIVYYFRISLFNQMTNLTALILHHIFALFRFGACSGVTITSEPGTKKHQQKFFSFLVSILGEEKKIHWKSLLSLVKNKWRVKRPKKDLYCFVLSKLGEDFSAFGVCFFPKICCNGSGRRRLFLREPTSGGQIIPTPIISYASDLNALILQIFFFFRFVKWFSVPTINL